MLVLSRRLGEALFIGDDIKVQILGIDGNQVRLGIAAPKSVNVVREEIAGTPIKEFGTSTTPNSMENVNRAHRIQPNISYLRRRKKTFE